MEVPVGRAFTVFDPSWSRGMAMLIPSGRLCRPMVAPALREGGVPVIKLWSWEKKPRTMLRYLKIGDIFCFRYDDHTYRFGRIMARAAFCPAQVMFSGSPSFSAISRLTS